MDTDLEKSFDVAIAGGGPAGSSCAIRLAEAGFSVLIAEQASFPRDKLCGEFISPECQMHFEDLGVLDKMQSAGATKIHQTSFFGQHTSTTIENSWFSDETRPAFGLSRAVMDATLLDRARSAGVTVLNYAAVTTPILDGNSVVGFNIRNGGKASKSILARIVIDATGRRNMIARRFAKRKAKTHSSVAFKAHIANACIAPNTCEMYIYRNGYGGCSPVENGLFDLCFIVNAKAIGLGNRDPSTIMRQTIMKNSRAAEVLASAEIVSPWHAVSIGHYGANELTPAKGLLTIGDAAAFIDPFTGSGILLALESAKIAADALSKWLASGEPFDHLSSDYHRRYAAAFRSRIRFSSLLRRAGMFPQAAESLIYLLSKSSRLRRRIARATR